MRTSWPCSADRSWLAAACQSMPAATCGCSPPQTHRPAGAAPLTAMSSGSPPRSLSASTSQGFRQRQCFFAGAVMTTLWSCRGQRHLRWDLPVPATPASLAAAGVVTYDGRRLGVRRRDQSLRAQSASAAAAGGSDGGRHLLSMLGQMMAGMQAQQPAPTGSHLSVRGLSFQPAGVLLPWRLICPLPGTQPLPGRDCAPRLGTSCCLVRCHENRSAEDTIVDGGDQSQRKVLSLRWTWLVSGKRPTSVLVHAVVRGEAPYL
jgi:hypothetical protein